MHITKSTLEYLGNKFEVEPGGGASREAYLADHKVESFLIIPPKVSSYSFIYFLFIHKIFNLLLLIRRRTLFYFFF